MFENTDASHKLYVKLHTNPFDRESYIGMVPRNTLSMDAVVTEIMKKDPGISKYAVYHSAELIKEEIMAQLATGCAVNVLDLGTMYIGVEGKITGSNPSPTDIPDFLIKFTPAPKVQESIASTAADGIMYSDEEPVIKVITGMTDGKTDGTLIAQDFVELTGRKLKVGGTGCGIFFAPAAADGNAETDETKWIAADLTTLRQNLPKTLRFKLPASLEKDVPYYIAVRTLISSSSREKKNASTGFSRITVKIAG